jgi:hypothetical protein
VVGGLQAGNGVGNLLPDVAADLEVVDEFGAGAPEAITAADAVDVRAVR